MNDSNVADIDGGPLTYEPSLFHYLNASLTSCPNSTAIIVAHQDRDHLREFTGRKSSSESASDNGSLTWTYAETQCAALKLVAGLRELNISTGSTVVTIMPSCIESLLFLWTSILAKFTLAPLDPGVVTKPRAAELSDLLERIKPDAIVVAGSADAVAVDSALQDLSMTNIVKISLSSTVNDAGWYPIERFAAQNLDNELVAQIEAEAKVDDQNRTQMILFTSGTTTGVPKGCPRSVLNAMHIIAAHVWGNSNNATARNLLHTPNFRIVYPALATSTWHRGGCVVIPGPILTLPGMIEAVHKYKVTMMLLLPTTVHVLVNHPDFAKVDRRQLKTIIVGADMVTEDAYKQACIAFPHSEVFNGHGSTEGASGFVWPFMGKTGVQPVPFYAGITPLGFVKPGARVKIADDVNKPVKRNEMGELHFCTASVITHYLDNVKPEDFYEDSDGRRWFKSGDTGLINNEGWVYIAGRKRDIFKRRGINIVPAALESCIDAYIPTQSSVLGVPDHMLGHMPLAVVRGLNGKSKDDVVKHVVDLFGPTHTLGGVVTLAELGLNEFPLNATGKILKRELKGPVAEYVKKERVL